MEEPTTSASSFESPHRSRLLALPAELRCLIWGFIFRRSDDRQIGLPTAWPPDGALLLTCREIHDEAREYFVAGSRNYWTGSHFVVHHEEELRRTPATNLSDSTLRLITRLSIVGKVVNFRYNDGIWTHVPHDGDSDLNSLYWIGRISCPDRAIRISGKATGYHSIDPRLPGVRFPRELSFWDPERAYLHACHYCELPMDMSVEGLSDVKQLVGWQPLTKLELNAWVDKLDCVES